MLTNIYYFEYTTCMITNNFQSRHKTPRYKLNLEAFENSGIEVFATEHIPFEEKTNKLFAKKIVDLIVLQNPKSNFNIYEFGAGTGILAKNILDILKAKHKSIYKITILHLSDYSKHTVKQLKNLDEFKVHKNHVKFYVSDLIDFEFKQKADFVYFTNLLDSLPSKHIKIKNNKIFEVKIKTKINPDAVVMDISKYPPEKIVGENIKKLFKNKKKRKLLAPQLLTTIYEKSKDFPIENKDLKIYVNTLNKNKNYIFNYSETGHKFFKNILNNLNKNGLVLFSDFGLAKPNSSGKGLWLDSNLNFFLAVDFNQYKQIAENKSCFPLMTSNSLERAQEMLIQKNENKKVTRYFKNNFNDNTYLEVEKFLEKINDSINNYKKYKILSKSAKLDYKLLSDLSHRLIINGKYKKALIFLKIMKSNYSYAIGTFYYVLKGDAETKLGEFRKAEKTYLEGIQLNKGYQIYKALAVLYLKQQKYREYIKILKKYIKITRDNDYERIIFEIQKAQKLIKLLKN